LEGSSGGYYSLGEGEERLFNRLLRALDNRSDELNKEARDLEQLWPEVVNKVDDEALYGSAMGGVWRDVWVSVSSGQKW
jgi:hypothetical protein